MAVIQELVGVYDADGTVLGEAAYWVGARLGRRHCSLCSITHGMFRERDDWKRCRDEMAVPFTTHHRDDVPDDVLTAAAGLLPVVVARTDGGVRLLLGPDDLEACGSPAALSDAISEVAGRSGLAWP